MNGKIGAFRIEGTISGGGGQGSVLRARCEEPCGMDGVAPGDVVALKAVPVAEPDAAARLETLKRRVDRLAAVRHPGVVRHFGCFAAEGGVGQTLLVTAMELLDGETLAVRIGNAPGGLDAEEVLRIVRTALGGLSAAAAAGVLHLDLKPSNLVVCRDGTATWIDFGLDGDAMASGVRGSFDYMAPDFLERLRPVPGFSGDERSDVFSFCVTVYEAATGRTPYRHRTPGDSTQARVSWYRRWNETDADAAARTDGGPLLVEDFRLWQLEGLASVLRKGLSPDREDRYAGFRDLEEAFGTVRTRRLDGLRDSYRLSHCVGKGGFGAVFKAFRISDGRPVAVKCRLRPGGDDRFEREIRELGRISDPRVVGRLDDGRVGDSRFLVMQFLEGMPGSSLRDRLREPAARFGLMPAEVLPAFERYAKGLAALHAENVFHRDLKPANLYLPAGRPDEACIMDLGIVRTDTTDTSNGLPPGTLDYMAPEIVAGKNRGDAASDVYSLGLCLYEAVVGQPLFPRLPPGEKGWAELFRRVSAMPVPDLSQLARFPDLRTLVGEMVDPDPARRPPGAETVAIRIRGLLSDLAKHAAEESATAETRFTEETRFEDPSAIPRIPRKCRVRMVPLVLIFAVVVGIAILALQPKTGLTFPQDPESVPVCDPASEPEPKTPDEPPVPDSAEKNEEDGNPAVPDSAEEHTEDAEPAPSSAEEHGEDGNPAVSGGANSPSEPPPATVEEESRAEADGGASAPSEPPPAAVEEESRAEAAEADGGASSPSEPPPTTVEEESQAEAAEADGGASSPSEPPPTTVKEESQAEAAEADGGASSPSESPPATETEVKVTFRNRNRGVAVRLIALDADRRGEPAIRLAPGGQSTVILPARRKLRFRVEAEESTDYSPSELIVDTEKTTPVLVRPEPVSRNSPLRGA